VPDIEAYAITHTCLVQTGFWVRPPLRRPGSPARPGPDLLQRKRPALGGASQAAGASLRVRNRCRAAWLAWAALPGFVW